MTKQEMIEAGELMIAWASSVDPTFSVQSKNRMGGDWVDRPFPVWDWQNFNYRRKPEPKLVPLGPEDVRPGSVVRCPNHDKQTWLMVLGVDPRFIEFQEGQDCLTETWEQLMEDRWEINRNDGKGWVACSKIEQ